MRIVRNSEAFASILKTMHVVTKEICSPDFQVILKHPFQITRKSGINISR